MKLDWTKGQEDDRAKEIELSFRSASILRRRLKELLDEKIESNRNAARAKQLYENPNWAYRVADSVGYERALYDIISLFEEVKNDEK